MMAENSGIKFETKNEHGRICHIYDQGQVAEWMDKNTDIKMPRTRKKIDG